MKEYSDIFSGVLGCTNLEEHGIQLNTDNAIRMKPYPVPFPRVGDIETEVNKMLTLRVIEPSKSPFCSPLLLVKKTDGSYRPRVDFRHLNQAKICSMRNLCLTLR